MNRSRALWTTLFATVVALALAPQARAFTLVHQHAFGEGGADPRSPLVFDASGNLFGTTFKGGTSNVGTVFRLRFDGTGFAVLHSFSGGASDGSSPSAGLVLDGAGNLYGTTRYGGASNLGTVFRMKTDGTGFAVVHSFAGGASDGSTPYSDLLLTGSGDLYGTTYYGGASDQGTVFKMKTDGTAFTLLHSFTGGAADGWSPDSGLILDGSGFLYGTTFVGGASVSGTIFRLRTDGTGFTVLHSFAGGASDGGWPHAGLVLDGSGYLYGTTISGGSSNLGTVFKIKSDGTGYALLRSFTGGTSDGSNPSAGLILDGFGNLYGTTTFGGTSANSGTVFKVKTDGTAYALLHTFAGGVSDGSMPLASVVLDGSGNVYGMASQGGAGGLGVVFRMGTDATGFTLLQSFPRGATDGKNPMSGLVLGGSGNLYGTTYYGGATDLGTIFTVKPDGTGFALLRTFAGGALDGRYPGSGLVSDSSGNLYGTTLAGGVLDKGTVFKLKVDGTGFVLLHSFAGGISDGQSPTAVVLDGSGNLFGTTSFGGGSSLGAVFRIKTDGTGFTLLHSFAGGGSDGNIPSSEGLIVDGAGYLYGTTLYGGSADWGTVYSLKTDGTGFTVLHSFSGDGRNPSAGVALDGAGILYGTTRYGGVSNLGTVFRIKTDGTSFTLLHSFAGGTSDGSTPFGGLSLDGAGNLYGTTTEGGPSNYGTVFSVKTDGSGLTLLHTFTGAPSDGSSPYSRLILDGSGILYGTTFWGGAWDAGVEFSLPSLVGPAPASFYSIIPCRLVDTRGAWGLWGGPALAAGATRLFAVTDRCAVPGTARALSVNVTAVPANVAGYLSVYPGGVLPPMTSTVNFKPDQVRANNAVVRLAADGSGGLNVLNAADAPTHFILDVNGYFE